MAPVSSPTGILLSKGYSVGPKLGEGAQAAVHAVLYQGEPAELVVKCAPLPPPRKNHKAKPKLDEINCNSLNKEYFIYNGSFKALQGTMIPSLGVTGWSNSGRLEQNGYRFLVLERMECDLFQGIPKIIRCAHKHSPHLDIGPIAAKLCDIVEKIHSCGHMMVDVKPENIMFAVDKAKETRKTLVHDIETLATRLRFVDFGLSRRFQSSHTGSHNENAGGPLVGTPLYSSRHLHQGNAPSRRDDLESLGLVVAELIIRLLASLQGKTKEYESTRIPSYLPWANEKDEESIGKLKLACMEDLDSEFYQRLGSATTAKTMYQYFEITLSTEYEKKPKYEVLKALLMSLQVSVPGDPRKTLSKGRAASIRSTSLRDHEKQSPSKKLKPVLYQPSSDSLITPRRSQRLAHSGKEPDQKSSTKTSGRQLSARILMKENDDTNDAQSLNSVLSGVKVPLKTIPFTVSAKLESAANAKPFVVPKATHTSSEGTLNIDDMISNKSEYSFCGADNGVMVSGVGCQPVRSLGRVCSGVTTGRNIMMNEIGSVEMLASPNKTANRFGHIDGNDSDDTCEDDYMSGVEYLEEEDEESLGGDIFMDAENIPSLAIPRNVSRVENETSSLRKDEKTLAVRVVDGPHKHDGICFVMSKKQDTLLIGNNSRRSKAPMIVLDKDSGILEVHCKLVFGVTRGGTSVISLTPKCDGVRVDQRVAPTGKVTTMLVNGGSQELKICNTTIQIAQERA